MHKFCGFLLLSNIFNCYHFSGNLIPRHQELFYKNPLFVGVRLPEIKEVEPLERRYPKLSPAVIEFAKVNSWNISYSSGFFCSVSNFQVFHNELGRKKCIMETAG